MAIHPKVSAGVVAGALTGLILSELNRRGIPIQPDEAADMTVLISALAGYFMPSGDAGANGNGAPPVAAPLPPPVLAPAIPPPPAQGPQP